MSTNVSAGSGNTLVLAAIAAASVAGAVYTSGLFAPNSLPQKNAPATPVVQQEPVAQPEAPAIVEIQPAAPEAIVELTPEAAPIIKPSIDSFLLTQDGFGQVAGRAKPNSTVTILLDGRPISQVEVAGDGTFFTLIALDPSADPRVLSLSQLEEGVEIVSDTSVIIGPSLAPATQEDTVVAMAEPSADDSANNAETSEETASSEGATNTTADGSAVTSSAVETEDNQQLAGAEDNGGVGASSDTQLSGNTAQEAETTVISAAEAGAETGAVAEAAETVTTAAVSSAAASEQPNAQTEIASTAPAEQVAVAPVVILADQDGVKVLQAPTPAAALAPEVLSSVAIDSISYSEAGDVQVAGRSPSGDFIRLYLDNELTTTVGIAPDGLWDVDLPDVPPGVYALRADQVTEDGTVVSRIETPFKREPSEKLVVATQEVSEKPVVAITVQPGTTLWAIAQESYGDGRLYVQVFEANKDRIRNPDLIYPGQIFSVPKVQTISAN